MGVVTHTHTQRRRDGGRNTHTEEGWSSNTHTHTEEGWGTHVNEGGIDIVGVWLSRYQLQLDTCIIIYRYNTCTCDDPVPDTLQQYSQGCIFWNLFFFGILSATALDCSLLLGNDRNALSNPFFLFWCM